MYGDGGSSDAIARDMNSLLHSSTFKHPSDGEFANIKELIFSDSYSNYNDHEHNHNHSRNQNQNHQRHDLGGQNESSLMRYRSAPSSFYANLLDESGCDDFLESVDTSSNHEPEERFFSSHQQQQQKFRSDSHEFSQYASTSTSMKLETKEAGIPKLDLPPVSTAMYGGSSQQAPHLPLCNGNGSYNHTNHNNLESSSTFRAMNSTSTNLIRQSSSPAGFLFSLNAETGMRDMDKGISASRLNNNHISFSSGPSSSPMYLPQIGENMNAMNDSTFRSLKRTRDGDSKMFHSSITMDTQNGASGHYTPSLVHHMSLPKTSSEMAVAEKFLQFQQDSIPCKTRAKRGCATHPRSIAERVRRTRISDRMKKLQELFPTMDKQTSTADMLDLVVQYIKDLQKNLQTLNNARARCTCSSKQLQTGK